MREGVVRAGRMSKTGGHGSLQLYSMVSAQSVRTLEMGDSFARDKGAIINETIQCNVYCTASKSNSNLFFHKKYQCQKKIAYGYRSLSNPSAKLWYLPCLVQPALSCFGHMPALLVPCWWSLIVPTWLVNFFASLSEEMWPRKTLFID